MYCNRPLCSLIWLESILVRSIPQRFVIPAISSLQPSLAQYKSSLNAKRQDDVSSVGKLTVLPKIFSSPRTFTHLCFHTEKAVGKVWRHAISPTPERPQNRPLKHTSLHVGRHGGEMATIAQCFRMAILPSAMFLSSTYVP